MKRQDLIKAHQEDLKVLQADLVKKEQALIEATLKHKLNQLKNVKQLKNLRKDIAQIKTIMHLKNLAAAETKPATKKA